MAWESREWSQLSLIQHRFYEQQRASFFFVGSLIMAAHWRFIQAYKTANLIIKEFSEAEGNDGREIVAYHELWTWQNDGNCLASWKKPYNCRMQCSGHGGVDHLISRKSINLYVSTRFTTIPRVFIPSPYNGQNWYRHEVSEETKTSVILGRTQIQTLPDVGVSLLIPLFYYQRNFFSMVNFYRNHWFFEGTDPIKWAWDEKR